MAALLSVPRGAAVTKRVLKSFVNQSRPRSVGSLAPTVRLQCSRYETSGPHVLTSTSMPPRVTQRDAMAVRFMSTGETVDVDKKMRELADKFGETRLELEDCADSVGTTYFNDDLEICIEYVDEVLDIYVKLLQYHEANGDTNGAKRLRESWALKLEQLKGELAQLLDSDDH